MEVTLSFSPHVSPSAFNETLDGSREILVIADSADAVQRLPHTIMATLPTKVVEGMASRLKPAANDVSLSECTTTDGRRVVTAILPTSVSRHNTPSRAWGVTAAVKAANLTEETGAIVLFPDNPEHAYAQGVAACRAFPRYSSKSSASKPRTVHVLIEGASQATVEEVRCSAAGIELCQRLVDMPPNELHSDHYIEECRRVATEVGATLKIIQGKLLDELGFGGLWGVGKASEHLPALVVLSHDGHGAGQSVCLVGKGIVYDTGGLSIKSKEGMPGMKHDMAGSAGVLGAFQALVAAKACTAGPLHAVLCIAENSVGPLATRPDDIHKLLSGKTVEINNTDAEGRLVLADGCAYAEQHLDPMYIIDMATLTGAQGVATGRHFAATYCNSDELEAAVVAAGKASGDLCHPLPYAPEYFQKEFASKVADFKNSVKDRSNAQASCAGQFIGNNIEGFLQRGGQWCHIDMAYPAMDAERSTGFGVALLYRLVASHLATNPQPIPPAKRQKEKN